METRRFTMHPHLLLDVMRRQAGTLSKAIAEGVMNSVDAGATRCDVGLTDKGLTIADDGKGFRSREEIEEWFERFGTPHEESEGKTYGTFRMGRGQIFSFGRNVWRTGRFKMSVDVASKGLDYDLSCDEAETRGCSIDVSLYKVLLPSELMGTLREIEKMLKYVPVRLSLNGKVVSVDPATEKWDHVTEEAYVRLRGGSGLSVYNLGVWVKDFSSWQLGTGGVVVSRKQLVLNFARNDIMERECAVWRKVKRLVDQKATERNKRKPTLDDDERKRLAEQVAAAEIEPREAADLKLFTDVSGRHVSASQLARSRNGGDLTVAPKGDRLGDKLHQSGAYFVMAEETLERFGVSTLKDLVGIVQSNCGIRHWKPRFVSFREATKGMDSKHVILDPKQWSPRERAWVSLIQSNQRSLAYGLVWGSDMDYGKAMAARRKVVVGESEAALAWTDGSTYVAYSRNFLRYLQFSMKGAMEAADVALHEQCHDDEDTGTHVHGPDFYQRYHDCHKGATEMAVSMFMDMPKAIQQHGQQMNQWILNQQDAAAKAALAIEKHGGMAGEQPPPKATIPLDPAPEPKPEPKPEVAASAVKVTAVQAVGGNPYKGSSSYGILFALGSQKEWLRDDLLAEAARLTGKPVASLAMSLQVLMNPNHKSNGGKSGAVRDGDTIRLVRHEGKAA